MTLPDRQLFLGVLLGAAAIAATTTAVLADQARANSIDPNRLVRFENRDYLVDYEDWVSTTPLTTTQVKKIEAGKVSYVTITTTATGTYSTDAMVSPHVQYPGISVQDADAERNVFRYWSNGRWSAFATGNAGSFVYYRATRK
jgi:hypothetical protein